MLRGIEVKGLRLYVRPIEAADHPALERFLGTATPPAWGLLGKLLGDLVAVVELEITGDALRVNDIFVAGELRKKRIGRAMMREVEQLAAKLEQRRIIVDDARGAQEFFRRVGFESEGDRWVRVVA
jgi:GNAT superfamily N-acetyltransferase